LLYSVKDRAGITALPTKYTSSWGISDNCAFSDGDWFVESEDLAASASDSVRHILQNDIVRRIARLASHTTSHLYFTANSSNH